MSTVSTISTVNTATVPTTVIPYPERLAELPFYADWRDLPPAGDTIDPFDYLQKLGIYRLLIETTSPNGIFGAQNEYNMFWGYVFQLDWQWRSGRLRLANTPEGRVDPNSIWGFGNYSLNVIPLVGAMRAGLTPQKTILPPDSPTRMPYIDARGNLPAVFEEAVREWQRFFEMLASMKPGSDLEPVRFRLWEAHHRSLLATEPALQTEGPRFASQTELTFLRGWIRMVDFLGAAAWHTDLPYMLENGVGWLPERPLTDQDVPGKVPEMDEKVNNNVRNIIALTQQPGWRFNFNLWLWKRAMRSRQARDEVLPMLDATFNPSPANVRERRKLLRYMLAL